MCDDITFEQIKKQLNRMVEVIKVMDLTNVPIHMKEIMFAKVKKLSNTDKAEVFRIAQVFHVETADIGVDSVLLECKLTERRNNELIELLKQRFQSVEIVRGTDRDSGSILLLCRTYGQTFQVIRFSCKQTGDFCENTNLIFYI